jgi:mitochondrial chaperone BCS1
MTFSDFLNIVQHNQALTLLLGGSAATAAIYYLKSLPKTLWNLFVWRFTSQVSITNDDAVFKTVSEWLSEQEFCQQARHLRCDTNVDDHTQQTNVRLCPGLGGMYFWYRGKPILLHRENPGGSQDRFGKPQETIKLRSFGSAATLRKLMADISLSANQSQDFIDVYLYRYSWQKVARKAKRPLDTVVLPTAQKDRIVASIQSFLFSKDWYGKMGIPYRKGLMFYGVPGTGKTSLVLALAGVFDLRVYSINLGSVESDQDLVNAITSIPEKSLLLIEDIDAAIASDRSTGNEEKENPVTLAGLLNAIDGVFSRDGRLLVMTTNHPEKLDAALTRPGRVDLKEEIGLLDSPEILTMCKQFLEDRGEQFAEQFTQPIAASELQKLLIQEKNK